MDAHEIVRTWESDYPGRRIIRIPEEDPLEIICEVKPAAESPAMSEAVAFIKRSVPHHHVKAKEVYGVYEGALTLFVDGVGHVLNEGDVFIIEPGSVHWAVSDGAHAVVFSEPAWVPDDHILDNVSVAEIEAAFKRKQEKAPKGI